MSEIVFLIASHSSFYWRRMLTHSNVNLTWAWGFWFIFISEISFLFRVFRAYWAALRVGKASFNILSASFFSSKALSVFSAITFSSYSTITLAALASVLSTSNFFNRFSCSTVFFYKIGLRSVSLIWSSSIILFVYSSLFTPFESLPIDDSTLFFWMFRKWLKLLRRSI